MKSFGVLVAALELHATKRPMPQVGEYRRRSVEASNRGNPRRPSSEIDEDDGELEKVFNASLGEQKAREQRFRRREEEIAIRAAADEAAAIAESAGFAAYPTAAQRQEADADAELERVLKESAAESEEKKARGKAALAYLHARFGDNSAAQQPRSSSSRDSAPSASSQRERANLVPCSPAAPSASQCERSNSAPREPAASSTEQLMPAGNNLLGGGVQLVQRSSRRANPRRAAPARLAEISEEFEPPLALAALPQSSNALRAAGNQPRAPVNLTREHEISPRQQPGSSRRQPHAPEQQPNPLDQRNSECAPHLERLPRGRASSSSRRHPEQARNHRELDPSIRQALNNSEGWARMEQGQGGHNLGEDEQMRMAIQMSLGDAPLPPDAMRAYRSASCISQN